MMNLEYTSHALTPADDMREQTALYEFAGISIADRDYADRVGLLVRFCHQNGLDYASRKASFGIPSYAFGMNVCFKIHGQDESRHFLVGRVDKLKDRDRIALFSWLAPQVTAPLTVFGG